MNLPLDELRAVALRELAKVKGAPLFITISGAHLYGFASPDSDFDVRGCHLMPLESALSIATPRETVEYTGIEDGREVDFVSHDAGKFFRLMLRKNGYVMEQVFSPLVVGGGADLEELRRIAAGCITKHIHHHYKGFYLNQRSMSAKEEPPRAKTLLYAYRVLLTGIHVLRTGVIEANLPALLGVYPQGGVAELMASKVKEKAGIPAAEADAHRRALEQLYAKLEEAHAESTLPELPREAEALDRFLVSLRLRGK